MQPKLMAILPVFLITACSTSEKITVHNQEVKIQQDKVIATLNDSSKPDWVEEFLEMPFQVEDGQVYVLGIAEMDGYTARPNIGFKVARQKAKSELAGVIETKINSIFSNSEENYDVSNIEYIGQEIVRLTLSGVYPDKQYYEKLAISDGAGSQRLIYRVYATIKMKEGLLKEKTLKAIREAEKASKISPEFVSKVEREWNSFVRSPASDEEQN